VDSPRRSVLFWPRFLQARAILQNVERSVTPASSSGAGGTLYLVATPIGNLEDITRRALRVLGEVDRVAAEDTRRTRRLLEHYGISVPLESLFEHNERARVPGLIRRLQAGERLAIVTDAGSPAVADPGYPLVRAAIEAGIRVESVPGPSALIAALQVSGFATDAFTFVGFLPVKAGARRRKLEELSTRRETIVAFESPHRIAACLEDLEAVWGARPVALARELTKTFEEVLRGSAREVRDALIEEKRRGEMVLVLSGWSRRDRAQGESDGAESDAMRRRSGRNRSENVTGGRT
jgi:16S rRNA (cytidine1402-2'-O)-methyltransferase